MLCWCNVIVISILTRHSSKFYIQKCFWHKIRWEMSDWLDIPLLVTSVTTPGLLCGHITGCKTLKLWNDSFWCWPHSKVTVCGGGFGVGGGSGEQDNWARRLGYWQKVQNYHTCWVVVKVYDKNINNFTHIFSDNIFNISPPPLKKNNTITVYI